MVRDTERRAPPAHSACWPAQRGRRSVCRRCRSPASSVVTPGPRIATTASASSSTGNANITSTTRINDRVEPAAAIARDHSDRHADHDGECDAHHRDPHRRLHGHQHPRQDVAAEFVGAEPVCRRSAACSAFGTSMSLMPYGAIHCAVTATNATTASTIALTTVTGLLASSRTPRAGFAPRPVWCRRRHLWS